MCADIYSYWRSGTALSMPQLDAVVSDKLWRIQDANRYLFAKHKYSKHYIDNCSNSTAMGKVTQSAKRTCNQFSQNEHRSMAITV